MKTFRQNRVLFMAQAAMIAAIYVVLTVIGASFPGLSCVNKTGEPSFILTNTAIIT